MASGAGGQFDNMNADDLRTWSLSHGMSRRSFCIDSRRGRPIAVDRRRTGTSRVPVRADRRQILHRTSRLLRGKRQDIDMCSSLPINEDDKDRPVESNRLRDDSADDHTDQWIAIAEERSAEFRAGKVQGVSLEELLDRLPGGEL